MATATPKNEMELETLLSELRRDMKRHNAAGREVVRSLARLEEYFASKGVRVVINDSREDK